MQYKLATKQLIKYGDEQFSDGNLLIAKGYTSQLPVEAMISRVTLPDIVPKTRRILLRSYTITVISGDLFAVKCSHIIL
jgi:hypothetical protein